MALEKKDTGLGAIVEIIIFWQNILYDFDVSIDTIAENIICANFLSSLIDTIEILG